MAIVSLTKHDNEPQTQYDEVINELFCSINDQIEIINKLKIEIDKILIPPPKVESEEKLTKCERIEAPIISTLNNIKSKINENTNMLKDIIDRSVI